jgi:hypothetical protein
VTAEGCTIELLGLDTTCQQAGMTTYITGCVNEHLDDDRYCERHAALLLDGGLLCTVCWPLGLRVPVVALAQVLPSGERVRLDLPSKIDPGGADVAGVASGGDGPRSGPGSPLTLPGADQLPV